MSSRHHLLARVCLLLLMAHACLASPPAGAAPDEAGYGADQGYPRSSLETMSQKPYLVDAHTAMERMFRSTPVRRGEHPVRPLPPAAQPLQWSELDTYLATHPATGLMILKDGKVFAERYQYGRTAVQRFTSWSMAKTVVAMAVGIAIEEKHIHSIDDPVDRYEPALALTAWKGVSIRHVLHMASGVKFDETYGVANSDVAQLSRAWSRQQRSLAEVLAGMTEREVAAGQRFKYISADTEVLGLVLAKATGRPLAGYVSEKIWGPMGAEDDASWLIDAKGVEAASCCLNARLRDYARLGQLLLDGGRNGERQVIPREWVESATSVRFRDGYLQPRRATPYLGYGYQVWLLPDDLGYALLGVRGQAVYVHPRLKLVMVQTAVYPEFVNNELGGQRDRFWRALVFRATRL
ncbi:MAG: serine hydrolase [Cytophagales bacterium]|nr:serine hydrolase [Rhizobacter sp.]